LIERFFSKLKHFRFVATRYDKLAANFLRMVQLASMRLSLRSRGPTGITAISADLDVKDGDSAQAAYVQATAAGTADARRAALDTRPSSLL